ncbi:hypothetical protein QPM17_09190 [Marinobacter sp. TBZ242]|uniref:Mannitol repressor n=1 Tax=Marinobacter azerbaijanicus TaxID=3050455 RepID=A0ABT7IAV9_9GAMM|nr:hypothetical protein [Marinobacter sp. TBZ242]MDL0431301.1 hypothetical protein [Marinobacter sp. TBZ242]
MFEDQKTMEFEFSEASDRAAVIVGASLLDEMLREILLSHLVSDKEKNNKEIFSGNGPLSTFSSKINMSYRLGLISNKERILLHGVRSIRNEFAHKLSKADFSIDSLSQRSKNLSIEKSLLMPFDIPIPSKEGEEVPLPEIKKADVNNPREIYQEAVMYLAYCLRARLMSAKAAQLEELPDFKEATEPAEMMLKIKESQMNDYKALLEKTGVMEDKDQEHLEKHDILIRTQRYCIQRAKLAHESA